MRVRSSTARRPHLAGSRGVRRAPRAVDQRLVASSSGGARCAIRHRQRTRIDIRRRVKQISMRKLQRRAVARPAFVNAPDDAKACRQPRCFLPQRRGPIDRRDPRHFPQRARLVCLGGQPAAGDTAGQPRAHQLAQQALSAWLGRQRALRCARRSGSKRNWFPQSRDLGRTMVGVIAYGRRTRRRWKAFSATRPLVRGAGVR